MSFVCHIKLNKTNITIINIQIFLMSYMTFNYHIINKVFDLLSWLANSDQLFSCTTN